MNFLFLKNAKTRSTEVTLLKILADDKISASEV